MIDQDELDAVAPGRSRSMEIRTFVDLDDIDPIYFSKTYYLGPRGEETGKVYALLRTAMGDSGKAAIASFVMRGKEYLAAVGLVGLGVPLAAAGERGVGWLGQMNTDPGRGQFLGDVPPPRAPLDRERGIPAAGEPRQPAAQVLPISRGDLAAPHLPGLGIEVVEGYLLPVDIQPAYDGHRDLLMLRRGARAP
jgi:hypothetical protein